MAMKTKILIAVGILIFLYLHKKKKDKKAEKIQEQVKENGLSADKTVDIIRYKLDEYIRGEFPFLDEQRIHDIVIGITSNLEQYELPEAVEIDYSDTDKYE